MLFGTVIIPHTRNTVCRYKSAIKSSITSWYPQIQCAKITFHRIDTSDKVNRHFIVSHQTARITYISCLFQTLNHKLHGTVKKVLPWFKTWNFSSRFFLICKQFILQITDYCLSWTVNSFNFHGRAADLQLKDRTATL